jgi:hypothetical protein
MAVLETGYFHTSITFFTLFPYVLFLHVSRSWVYMEVKSYSRLLLTNLLEKLGACALNSDTFHAVPVAPSADHYPELSLPPSDGDHRPHGTTHLGASEKGLLHKSCLDLADVR